MSSLTSEAYNQFGFEIDYYVKQISTKRDRLFGEDPLENIVRRFRLSVYTDKIPNLQKKYQLQGMLYEEVFEVQATIAHKSSKSRRLSHTSTRLASTTTTELRSSTRCTSRRSAT